MTDEPGSPRSEADRTDLMVRLAKAVILADAADGRAGLGAVLRELREADPEALDRLAAGLQLRTVGRGRTTAH